MSAAGFPPGSHSVQGPARRRLRRSAHRWLAALGVLAGAWLVTEQQARALDVPITTYQAAAAGGRLGVVAGRALAEARRPGNRDAPLSGFSVTLVPRSKEFLARLNDIADRGRRDLTAHARTATDIVGARREYERALAGAGAAELVMGSPVAPDGRFEVVNVPAGEWLLVALRPVFVARPSPVTRSKDKETFAPRARISGYYAVSVWIRELAVVAGKETVVALTDRNIMMTAIEEKPASGAGR